MIGVAVGDAIAALRRYSLVSPAGDGLVLVHRLVQALTRAQLPVDKADPWEWAAAILVDVAIPARPQLPATWPVCAQLLPHARVVLHPDQQRHVPGSRGISGLSGSHPTARDLFGLIADAHRDSDSYGPERPGHPVRPPRARAIWTGVAGDAAGARDQHGALLPIIERLRGPEHPDTLFARHGLARWSGEAGDVAGARDQHAALLPIIERVLGH